MSHVYDAIATLAMILGGLVALLLAWRAFAVIAWIERHTGLRRSGDTRPRRTTIMQGGRRMTLTSEQLPEQ